MFAKEYTEEITMTTRNDYLTQRLEKNAIRTKDFFEALDEKQWLVEVYSEGASWSVRQILAHFVATEKNIARLVLNIVNDSGALPEDFDVDRFNEGAVNKLESLSTDVLLDAFLDARQQMITMVAQFTDANLDKIGRHSWFKSAPIEDMIKLIYRHNQIHQRDIRKTLGT
jgi:hypothetical protein